MNNERKADGFRMEAIVAALADAVRKCQPGDQAALRRMVPASPPLVFYRLLLEHTAEWSDSEYERAWVAIMQGMALLALPNGEQSLGSVLGQSSAGSGQSRFWRLLEARGETFYDLLRHIIRMLAHEGGSVDWTDIAKLCLSRGETRENCRRKLARDFCHAQQKQSRNNLPGQPGKEQGVAS
ncbi:MAG: type I-E CRISPR-associated protein Cse2/CasB [Desulfovibrio sp.]|jgi:CRISPR type I-E-associated protein CasB/Cse2|nr:type I-E CRISPR-associated protein Cse2/CasB [Desulfovibrio sp.]